MFGAFDKLVRSRLRTNGEWTKALGLASGTVSVVGIWSFLSTSRNVHASEDKLHPPHYPWNHRYPWQSLDHASIRRGFKVYQQVCSTCHSLEFVAYRHLVDQCLTEEEARVAAADRDFLDGPNDEGEMYERPGRLTDYMPKPYANKQAGRFANNGAYPPDLSLVVKARENHENYIFSLLVGYKDPPAGVNLRQGLFYNPYFPGGAIAMPQALVEGAMDWDDGTPSSISQMAKDVTTFLMWTSEPYFDDRKRIFWKSLFTLSMIVLPLFWLKKFKWQVLKTRVVRFKD